MILNMMLRIVSGHLPTMLTSLCSIVSTTKQRTVNLSYTIKIAMKIKYYFHNIKCQHSGINISTTTKY